MHVPLVMADKYEAGCGLGDMGCMTEEALVRFFLDVMNWLVDTLAWAMNLGSVTTDSPYWEGAVTMSSFWLGIASFVGVVIVGALGVTKGIVKGQRDTITRSVLGVAFAVPSTLISIWLVGYLLDALETLTAPLIAAAFGGDMGEALMNYLVPNASEYLDQDSAQGRGELLADAMLSSTLGMWAPLGLILAIIGATFVVIAINVLRNVLLQMLIAAAPLVFMMMPVGLGKEIIVSWAKLTAMVFIMKPMVIMYVAMMIAGMVHSSRTIWDVEGFPYAVGLLMVIVVPFAVMGMFNFFGLDTDAGGREVGQMGTRVLSATRGIRGGGSRRSTQGRGTNGRPGANGQSAPASRMVRGSSTPSASNGSSTPNASSAPSAPSTGSGPSSGPSGGSGSGPGSGASAPAPGNGSSTPPNSNSTPRSSSSHGSSNPQPGSGGSNSTPRPNSGGGTTPRPDSGYNGGSKNALGPDSRSNTGPRPTPSQRPE